LIARLARVGLADDLTRSSTVNSGCFSGFTRMAIVTSSNTLRPRAMMSRWPFVIGSNEPG
jgi:hypothetical protein